MKTERGDERRRRGDEIRRMEEGGMRRERGDTESGDRDRRVISNSN